MTVHITDTVIMAVGGDGAIIARADRWSPESSVWTVPVDRSGPLWSAPSSWASLVLDRTGATTAMVLASRLAGGASQNDSHVVAWWDEVMACHERMMSGSSKVATPKVSNVKCD